MRRLIVGLTLALALVTPPAAARQAVALVNPPAAQHAIGLMNPRVLAPRVSDFPAGAAIQGHVDTTAMAVNKDNFFQDHSTAQGNRYQQLHFGGSLFETAQLPPLQFTQRRLWLMATFFPSPAAAASADASDAAEIPQKSGGLCRAQAVPLPKQVSATTTCAYIDSTNNESGLYVIATIGNVEFIVLGFVGSASPADLPAARVRAVSDASFLALHEAQLVIPLVFPPHLPMRDWQSQQNPDTGTKYHDGIACPGPETCYVVGAATLATTNGGVSWHTQTGSFGSGLSFVACPGVRTCFSVGGHGTIVATTNSGATWTAQHSGTSRDLYGIACPSRTTCVAVGTNGTILTTGDGGHTWTSRQNPDSGTTHAVDAVACPSVTVCYTVGYSTLATTDGGQSWHAQVGSPNYYLYSIACPSVSTCFSVGYHGTIVATTDGGATPWSPQHSGTSNNLLGIACPSVRACTVVGDKGTILRTGDGGATWHARRSGTRTRLWAVTCTGLGACYAVGDKGIILVHAFVAVPTISTFYLSTKAAYDVWTPQVAPAAPPRVDTFPTTMQVLAYYFTYNGATRSTKFQVHVLDHTGALLIAGASYTLGPPANGQDMGTFSAPHGGDFPPGTYTAYLVTNGHAITRVTFTVAPTVPPRPTISTFYTSTRKAVDAWLAGANAPPPRVSTFPAHTRDVAFYFEYSGGGTGSFSAQGYIRDHNGNVVVSNGVGYLSLTSHAAAGPLTAPLTGGYAAGTYTISLLINGQAIPKSATFTVRGTGAGSA